MVIDRTSDEGVKAFNLILIKRNTCNYYLQKMCNIQILNDNLIDQDPTTLKHAEYPVTQAIAYCPVEPTKSV